MNRVSCVLRRFLCAWIALSSLPVLAGVTISPSNLDVTTTAVVTLTASVPSGATATIDILMDTNGNGTMDTGELDWRRYTVTDGAPAPPEGALLAADTDGLANGSIVVPILGGSSHDPLIAGHYIARVKVNGVSSQATFTVNPPTASQSVAGQVLLGGVGKPGVVIVLDGTGQMLYVTLTDASGNYTAPVPYGGSYMLTACVVGQSMFIPPLQVTVSAGQRKTGFNLSASSAPYRWQGQVVRSDNNQPVPYIWIQAQSAGGHLPAVLGPTDANGNFDLPIANGTWTVQVLEGAEALGFQSGSFEGDRGTLTVNGANATNLSYPLLPIVGFIVGQAKNGQTNANLAGVKLQAMPSGSNQSTIEVMSDQNGKFTLGVSADTWDVWPEIDTDSPLIHSMLFPNVHFTETLSASQTWQDIGTITCLPADGSVWLKVVDDMNQPLTNIGVFGQDNNNVVNPYCANAAPTDVAGITNLPIRTDGTWEAGLSSDSFQGTNYQIPPNHRLDILAQAGNTFTVYPAGTRKRPYRVYGGTTIPANTFYPQDSGFQLLGEATGTATFSGSYPYYYIEAYEGEVLVDSVEGLDGAFYGAASSGSTLNAGLVAGRPDRQYATVGDFDGNPSIGDLGIQPGTTLAGVRVIHPDEPYTAAREWMLYE